MLQATLWLPWKLKPRVHFLVRFEDQKAREIHAEVNWCESSNLRNEELLKLHQGNAVRNVGEVVERGFKGSLLSRGSVQDESERVLVLRAVECDPRRVVWPTTSDENTKTGCVTRNRVAVLDDNKQRKTTAKGHNILTQHVMEPNNDHE